MSYVHLILPRIPTGWPLQNRFTQWWASPKNSTSHPNIHKKKSSTSRICLQVCILCFWVLCSFIFKPRIFLPMFLASFLGSSNKAFPWQIQAEYLASVLPATYWSLSPSLFARVADLSSWARSPTARAALQMWRSGSIGPIGIYPLVMSK